MAGDASNQAKAAQETIILGQLSGLYGVKGWLKVFSHTQPKEQILKYQPWLIKLNNQWHSIKVLAGRQHGKTVVAQLEGINDREQARQYIGCEIAIAREQLPQTAPGEYYWADLIGMQVVNTEGLLLGVIDHLFATGANDVIVVQGEEQEYLIPFVQPQYVVQVDMQKRMMTVDWLPEYS